VAPRNARATADDAGDRLSEPEEPYRLSKHLVAFRQGLEQEGFVEGQNVTIIFRYAGGQINRLPTLASELVRRGVNVFVATGGTGSLVKAKPVVPPTIPIVFAMGGDPVKLGVVASLARPGDNITGVSFLLTEIAAKEIELLHERYLYRQGPQGDSTW
jgi:putative tryptophan/tyrosine transport system substrate-binding protein